jgi:Na+-transporting methylmalonyl-CoA/oxaloacetate decarboxylase gamma subunit
MLGSTSELLTDGLSLAAVGVGVVFAALVVVGLVVAIIGHFARDKPPVPAALAGSLPEDSLLGVSKHTIVLLAAAASVACKQPVRIRRVRFVSHKQLPTSWAATGRADHRQENL